MDNLEEQINEEAYNSAMADELEASMGWDGDWSKVVNHYDGTR